MKGLRFAKKGFLLLEVLISITVITVGLVYIIRSFSVSTRAIKTSRNYMRAVSLLEQKIWELEAAGSVETGDDEDVFEDDERFSWYLSAESDEDLPINETRLQVTWNDRTRTQRVSLTTYLWEEEDE